MDGDDPDPEDDLIFQRFLSGTDHRQFNHRAVPAPVLKLNPGDTEPVYFLGVDPGNGGVEVVFYPNNDEQGDLSTVWDEITIHAIVIEDDVPTRHDFPLELPEQAWYRIPSDAIVFQPEPGDEDPIRVVSARFWSTPVFRDGYMWATHHVRNSEDNTHAVQWYIINMNGWPDGDDPELESWGIISPVTDGGHTIFPSVSVNFWHDMLISYTEVGPNKLAQPRWMLRTANETVYSAWIPIDDDLGVITEDLNSGKIRWGDYSGTVADPTDWCRFWTYHLWAKDEVEDKWQTWLSMEHIEALCEQEFGPDYNGDSEVDEYDILEFSALFNANSRRADFNRDRVIDAFDYTAFMEAWNRGRR